MSYNTRKKSAKFVVDSSSDDFSESGSEYKGSSSSESSEANTSEEDLDEEEEQEEQEGRKKDVQIGAKLSKGLSAKAITSGDNIYVVNTDDYFHSSSQKKPIISNNALDKLETPRLQQEQLHKLLTNTRLVKKHKKCLKELEDLVTCQFNKWIFLLHEGFNILVYGLGSKMKILKQFQQDYLNDHPVIVVNGFFPSLSIKNIVDALMGEVLNLSENSASIYDNCDLIAQKMLYLPTLHVYIIVHNIEGDMIKNAKAQSVLSKLASVKNIHLIASIDHVSAPLMWDNSKLSKFNFIWFNATSFSPYMDETAFEGSIAVQSSKSLALSSLKNVFLSLTSNSKGIYMIIVKYQLENGSAAHYQGFLFKDLYWACREAFLVSSDLALRSQLTEFVDHKMLKFRRSADGSEYVVIPMAHSILQMFCDEQT